MTNLPPHLPPSWRLAAFLLLVALVAAIFTSGAQT